MVSYVLILINHLFVCIKHDFVFGSVLIKEESDDEMKECYVRPLAERGDWWNYYLKTDATVLDLKTLVAGTRRLKISDIRLYMWVINLGDREQLDPYEIIDHGRYKMVLITYNGIQSYLF